ncbi:MAG TPA: hypothetical protein PLY93_07040 [Turneriella sp.]|nr:hypothetical protein [Turneriella sp.]
MQTNKLKLLALALAGLLLSALHAQETSAVDRMSDLLVKKSENKYDRVIVIAIDGVPEYDAQKPFSKLVT